MKKINLILVFLLLSIWSFGQLTVTVSSIPAMAGQTVNVPIRLPGTGTPISSINLSIVFDTAQLEYVTTTNFTPQAPAPEWAFSAKYNESCNGFAANATWAHPSGQSTSFTEGTTLYELQFLYKGGNGPLTFCIYQIKDANNDPIAVTAVNGLVHPPVLTGATTVCEGSSGNIYSTDAGQTNYLWSLTGGTITSGGGTTDHTATVTWNTAGSQNISVTYSGTVTATMPVLVNTSAAQAGVTINATENAVCAGTSVSFTASPVNGGTTPSYQWKKNGTDVGANSPVYTYTPGNNDVITCVMTSDLGCVTGNPATSNAITMSVTAKVTASVSVVASQNPVTSGTTVTMTANPVNGGVTPSFEWKLNGVIVGSNSSTYSFIPVNGDQVFCLMTTSLSCVNNSIATSNVVTMSVNNTNALVVTLPSKTAIPGNILYFPVKLKGAGSTGAPISGANIQISYDTSILAYDTIVNFYGPMPSSQWFFSGNNSVVSANWIEPNLQTLAIPDSTTLFEIRFTYLGGTGQLPFLTYEFTNATFDFIPTTPYNGSVMPVLPQMGYLSGDFHQHTTYTDGSYSFAHVMAKSNQYNLDWWANSEHGGGFNRDGEVSGTDLGTTVYWDSYSPNPIVGTVASSSGHQNMWRWQSLRDYSFENVLSARTTYPNRMIFQAYEFNVPGHEHASMGLINNQFLATPNCNPLAEFEFKFDNSDVDMIGGVAQGWTKSTLSGHAKAVEAITWLQTNYPNTSYVIAAHPERQNKNSIAGFRDMNNAGPDVCFGFESMPGHQRGPDRGEYKPSYGTVGTTTYGGCGIYAGKVGGLWDAMLSEGRSWWLFASSDFHSLSADFYPGEYQKTYTFVNNRYNPQSYIDGLRSGNSYIVNGDLIDSLQFRIGESTAMPVYASMGETFANTDGSVVIKIKVRDPQTPNNNTFSSYTNPELNHIDLIMGKVHGLVAPGSPNYSVDTVATTGIIARFDAVGGVSSPNGVVSQAWTDLGNGWKEINYAYNGLTDTAYFRIRGTNHGLGVQNETDANGNPLSDGLMSPNSPEKAFADLWFYSNPIFVAGPSVPTLSGPTTVCNGSSGHVYTTESGKTNYQWTVTGGMITAGGTTSDNYATITWNSVGSQSVAVSYSGSITTTLPVSVNTFLPAGISISASENTVCTGSSVTFTATPVNGGSNPVYQWKKNSVNVGANTPVYTVVPANNDVITCELTSDLSCATGNPATSNAITMTVTAKVTASVSISASQNPVTPGTTVTMTANPVNGGATPSFEWKLNGVTVGTNASTYSFVPVNGDQVFCLMTTSLTCVNNAIATSNVVTMSVTNPNALIVTLPSKIATPGDILYFPVKLKGASNTGVPISGANIQISYDPAILDYDTLVNFYGPMPSSQWFFSGNNNIVSANWIESNLQTLAVPDSTTLFEIKFTYLGGSQTLPFVAYEFTNASFDLIPTTPYHGAVSQTCPVSVTVSASENPVCTGTSVTFTATPVNGGSNPVYQWKKNSANVGTNSPVYTVVPANNDVITCELTSDTICATGNPATSNAITMSVTAKVTASVSIVASQNPVTSGTTVTMTANPVNGGAMPSFEWKLNGVTVGSNASTYSFVPANGDQVFCLMTTSLTCVNNAIATSNVVTMSVSNPNTLTVTLPDQSAMPGDVLHFPVKLVGAGSNGVPISGVNVQIAYDTTVLAYDTLVNFYSQMPTTQWIYSGNNSLVSANWIEPSLSTLPVPDNTTLFEIRFTYLGGNSSLPFVTYEFTDATFELIPTAHVDGSVSQLVPNQELVQNVTVGNGTDTCFNALQTITVAGNGTTFTVQNGGSAELIAGQKITMLPGTTVQPGGYLHAWITLTNSFCNQQPNPVVASAVSEQEITSAPQLAPVHSGVKLYPNPTEGSFTVSLTGDEQMLITAVSIYSATGLKVSTMRTEGVRKLESSLSGFAPGIYFVHVTTLTGSEILKIVKL